MVESTDVMRSVAVVGSGISGLTVAIRLKMAGISTVVFEKSRGPGGRLATRRVSDGAVDVGAQYFTIRSSAFRTFLDRYAGEDCYAEWSAALRYQLPDHSWTDFRLATRYVGVPRMTAVSRALSADLDVRYETRIARLERDLHHQWIVFDTAGEAQGRFDGVIVTTPPAQAQDLLADSGLESPYKDRVFDNHPLAPCWTVAMRLVEPLPLADGFSAEHPVLQWAANNTSKPGRSGDGHWWVLHARADWSEMHQAAAPAWVREQLLNAFGEVAGSLPCVEETRIHRWLYAKIVNDQPGPGHRWYPNPRIGLCGDWLAGGRVEGAFESAESLIAELRANGATS